MLRVTTPAGAGKSEFLLEQFREAVREGRRDFRFVVPTATMVQHRRNEMAREGLLVQAESIVTFSKLTSALVPAVRTVPDELFALLVEDAVKRLDRAEFAAVARLPGFHASLAATIKEFDAAGCSAARLARALPPDALAPFARAFSAVWNEVDAAMSANQVLMRGAVLLAAARLVRESPPALKTLWFDGFAVFSVPELELIHALGENADVTAILPSAQPREAATSAFRADSPEREADEIARRILHQSAQGRPFRDIGIILRQPDFLAPLISATLERYGIPFRSYNSSPLAQHPVGQFFTALLDAMLSGWEHEQTVAAMRLSPRSGASRSVDRLDIKMRDNLPNRGLDSLRGMTNAGEAAARLLGEFGKLDSWRAIRRTPAQWVEQFRTLRSLFHPGTVPDALTPVQAEMYRSQNRALDRFDVAFQAAADPLIRGQAPARAIALSEFWLAVKAILRLAPLRTPDRRRNVVHLLSAYEARQWDLAVVFIPGLIEKEFPKQHPQNAFFPDEALRDLRRHGIRLRTAVDLDAEEQALFDSACACATHALVLSYPVSGLRGDQPLPSPFFIAATTGLEIEIPENVRPFPIVNREASFHPVAIRHQELLPMLHQRHPAFSPSALESYLQCPFQFFAKKTLKLREFPPRPEDRLDPLLLGTIVHEILKEWFPTRPDLAPLIESVFNRVCAEKNIPFGFQIEVKRHELVKALGEFEPLHQWPRPISVETELDCAFTLDPDIPISGRLDRVETYPDGIGVVVDYKYSRASNTKSKTTDDTKVQGPLYLLALEKQFNLRASAMIYCSVKEEAKLFGWGEVPGLNDKQARNLQPLTRAWRDGAINEVRRAVAEIRSGLIHARPATIEPCRYCDFRDACRYTATATRAASEA